MQRCYFLSMEILRRSNSAACFDQRKTSEIKVKYSSENEKFLRYFSNIVPKRLKKKRWSEWRTHVTIMSELNLLRLSQDLTAPLRKAWKNKVHFCESASNAPNDSGNGQWSNFLKAIRRRWNRMVHTIALSQVFISLFIYSSIILNKDNSFTNVFVLLEAMAWTKRKLMPQQSNL